MSLDIALTLVRGPGWLSALAPLLVPLLLFFRPATNRDRPAANQDHPATNRDWLTQIKTAVPQIETALPQIEIMSSGLENKYQEDNI